MVRRAACPLWAVTPLFSLWVVPDSPLPQKPLKHRAAASYNCILQQPTFGTSIFPHHITRAVPCHLSGAAAPAQDFGTGVEAASHRVSVLLMEAAGSSLEKVPEPQLESPRTTLRKKLQRTFDTFDTDGSGEVSTEEITKMLQFLGVDTLPDQIEALILAADTDNSGEISFEEFFEAMKGAEFAKLFSTAAHPADVARSLEEANSHFLVSFSELIVGALAACQDEVLAAKVPLASYGRVKSALDTVKSVLAGTGQDLLTTELGELRVKAIHSMHAQRAQMEADFLAEREFVVSRKDAEIKELRERSSQPEMIIAGLEGELEQCKKQLAEASGRLTKLEAATTRNEAEWKSGHLKALEMCTVAPPPPPADPPFIKVLIRS